MTFVIKNSKLPQSQKVRQATMRDQRAMEAYRQAYKDVYGIPGNVRKEGKWFYPPNGQGVSLRRLKELTRMLRDRADAQGLTN